MSQVTASENAIAPATPDTGKSIIYPKSDGLWYSKDDAGVETPLGGGGATGLTEQTTSNTGAQNDFDLNGSNIFLRCTGAAPVFSGFTVGGLAPSPGDTVIIECLGTTAKVVKETLSTAANRIITPSASGQIVGVNGRMQLVYDGVTDRWRESLITPGELIAIPFNAADFTSDTGTWVVASGDVSIDKYMQIGKLLYLWLTVNTSTVTGTPNSFRKALPTGFNLIAGNQYCSLGPGYDNNVFTAIVPNDLNGGSRAVVRINRSDFANWANSTDATWVYFSGNIFLID